MAALPSDYLDRVYAGVLGKIIGVYLGRPFEGWSKAHIEERLGEISYYVHERLGQPLIVTDDDITGTFAFLRALPEHGFPAELTPGQVGDTWMNGLIEGRTILWWGGMGMSTEHTAFLRMKHGMRAPDSGSIATNGQVVAEQIGAQIFIDGWGMVCPNDPERAASYARAAARVSHDGEAVHAAVFLAAMEAIAFSESDIDRLIDGGLAHIPADSLITRMVADIRAWHAEGLDWRAGFDRIEAEYGYAKYGGNCHVIPNHALIIHALLHGAGDFSRSLMIVNTCGWDTDCNSGNLGCLLGILGGLDAIDNGPDWRGPVADRMYLPAADGRFAITDAAAEAIRIVNYARTRHGEAPLAPKDGARFHFSLPGSVQGFMSVDEPVSRDVAEAFQFGQSLAIPYRHLATGRVARVGTATFIPSEAAKMGGYSLIASPTLYPAQTVRAHVSAEPDNLDPVTVAVYVGHYDAKDEVRRISGPAVVLEPGDEADLELLVPDLGGLPTCEVGIEITSEARVDGMIFLDSLTWDGMPQVVLKRPAGGTMWRRAWVNGLSDFMDWGEAYRLVQNEGTGLLMQGGPDWADLTVEATVVPHMVARGGLAVRVQGMRRWVGLLLYPDGTIRLVRSLGEETELASVPLDWKLGDAVALRLEARGNRFRGYVGDERVIEATDDALVDGGIGLVVTEGRMATEEVRVS
ncbi:MAG: ADP-ribosylglycohydrolase family protein [Fimbriimonas sp.]